MTLWNVCSAQGKETEMKTELTEFLNTLKTNKRSLTKQQYRTIRGQALKGNVMDARKGLQKVLKRRCG